VQAQARALLLQDPAKKNQVDNPQTGFLRYAMMSVNVPPFDNADCRKAVLHAADHTAIQAAWGGPIGGDIATTALPPNVAGYKQADVYGFLANPNGNPEQAKQSLAACGQPNGFSTKIAVRGDRPEDVASGEALQQSLERVGIKTEIAKYPSGDWSAQYAGNPKFVKANGLGIMVAGWGADWPSGFGFLSQIADGDAIAPNGGNYNQMELNDPTINKLLDDGIQTTDLDARNEIWSQVDAKVMESGALLPFVYEKTLLYRGPSLTNVFVSPSYGMYDFTTLGKQ
jgi:peptide/nickel transport system substrate-binding protein